MAYPAPITDQAIADQLTRDGLHWNTSSLTYSFDNFSTGGNALNATQELWIERSITIIEEMFDLEFTLLTSGAGDITFNGSSGNGTYAGTSYWPSSGNIASVDIFFDQSWNSNQSHNLSYGSYGLTTIIHEFLHGLGLDHPGNYNAGEGGPITYLDDAEFLQDTHRYTVMSYFDSFEDGSASAFFDYDDWSFLYPQTPMVYDLLAMTEGSFDGKFTGYGLNTATRAGDTIYGYNASAGINQVYDFDVNGTPVLTIHDGGGTDTLDVSGDTVSSNMAITYNGDGSVGNMSIVARTISTIDIREGQYSSTHGMVNNIGIAFGTVIENVISGALEDTIYGNDADNVIDSGSGADTVFGFGGSDTFVSGEGADTYDGGDGCDTVDYSGSSAGINVDLVAGTGTGGDAEGDHFSDIEKVIGSVHADTFLGNGDRNILLGGVGNDTIVGGGGNDALFGEDGNDTINAGTGDDWINGGGGMDMAVFDSGADITIDLRLTGFQDTGEGSDLFKFVESITTAGGSDTLDGDDGRNIFLAGNGNDTLNGHGGNDALFGEDGNDTINAGAGNDWINGGGGMDMAVFDSGADVTVDLRLTTVQNTGEGDDFLKFIESITTGAGADTLDGDDGRNIFMAGNGNDTLNGHGGNDALFGEHGNDTIDGGLGHDWINGGAGNDLLTGGGGSDTFIFGNGFHTDTITDFDIALDQVKIVSGATEYSQLTIDEVNGSAQVTLSGAILVFTGVAEADLTEDHFIF